MNTCTQFAGPGATNPDVQTCATRRQHADCLTRVMEAERSLDQVSGRVSWTALAIQRAIHRPTAERIAAAREATALLRRSLDLVDQHLNDAADKAIA